MRTKGGRIVNARQQAFADEYIKTRNATRAYMSAYPDASERSAGSNADRMMKNDEISAYIKQRLDEISDAQIMSAKDIMLFYSSVVRGEKGEILIDNRGDEHEVPSRMSDRINAADKLAKMLGADKKPDISDGGGDVVIVDDV